MCLASGGDCGDDHPAVVTNGLGTDRAGCWCVHLRYVGGRRTLSMGVEEKRPKACCTDAATGLVALSARLPSRWPGGESS